MVTTLSPESTLNMSDNYILQIDTATEICSIALSRNGMVLDQIQHDEPNVHASHLTLFIQEIMVRNKLSLNDMDAIAVSMGPGSYTGLRIGVSTAKGLCYALDVPMIAINTLHSMYEGLEQINTQMPDTLFFPMIDARRMEVYTATFDHKGIEINSTRAEIIDEHAFDSYQNKEVVLFGSGALKFKELFAQREDIRIEEKFLHSAAHMSKLVWQKFVNREFEDLIYFEPYYLKEFVATTPKKH